MPFNRAHLPKLQVVSSLPSMNTPTQKKTGHGRSAFILATFFIGATASVPAVI
jgi:hypothetical protein